MDMSRRTALHFAGAGCALALLPSVPVAASTLRRYEVQDSLALPRFAPGDVVVADTGGMGFTGAGLYLYPAWGAPRLYEIAAGHKGLEFRNPGSRQLLWTQSATVDATFAGKVLDLAPGAAPAAECPALAVPALPLA